MIRCLKIRLSNDEVVGSDVSAPAVLVFPVLHPPVSFLYSRQLQSYSNPFTFSLQDSFSYQGLGGEERGERGKDSSNISSKISFT